MAKLPKTRPLFSFERVILYKLYLFRVPDRSCGEFQMFGFRSDLASGEVGDNGKSRHDF